jgi:hypothetical protein
MAIERKAQFTAKEKADEALRELQMRKRVYPRQAGRGGQMSSTQIRQIAIMQEIEREYREQIPADVAVEPFENVDMFDNDPDGDHGTEEQKGAYSR